MIARQIEIHPEALAEVQAALSWYAERSSRAPAAFIQEIDSAINLILDAPERWPRYDQDFSPLYSQPLPVFHCLLRKTKPEIADSCYCPCSAPARLLAESHAVGSHFYDW